MARVSPRTLFAVALGGVLGGGLRLAAMEMFPLGQEPLNTWLALSGEFLTLTVINLVGSFALGWVSGIASHAAWPEWARVGLSTGVLGSFTTLSGLTTAWLAALAVLSTSSATSGASLATAGALGLVMLFGSTMLGALLAAAGIRTADRRTGREE